MLEKNKLEKPFIYSDNNKRYHTLAYHNRQIFGERVYKASINLGCTCPNADGSLGLGGCTYCEGPTTKAVSLSDQMTREARRIEQKNPNAKIIAYFQHGTNTYCNAEFLYERCCQVLKFPNVIGISIGTRADCIEESMADMLYSLSKETHLTVELGLQTIHNAAARRINRCHTYQQFLEGYNVLFERSIRTCIHLINSLPEETMDMMVESAVEIGKLKPGAVKIHMLNIMEGTEMAKQYKASPFHLQSREEYVETIVRQLEHIPPSTVIERLTGDGIKSRIIAPHWVCDKLKTLVEIDKLQALSNSFQGKALL